MSWLQSLGQLDSITIGLWVTGFMLLFVVMGVRVAFAAALAGFIGLLWIFSARMGFEKGVVVKKEYHRRGIANHLNSLGLGMLRDMGVKHFWYRIDSDNLSSLKFAEKHGNRI